MTFPQIEFPLRLAHSPRLREKNPTENVNVFSILFWRLLPILLEKKKSFCVRKNCILLQGGKSVHTALVHFPRKKREIFLFQLERRNKFDDSRKVHQWKFSSDRSRLDKKNCVLTQIPRKRKTALLKKKSNRQRQGSNAFFQNRLPFSVAFDQSCFKCLFLFFNVFVSLQPFSWMAFYGKRRHLQRLKEKKGGGFDFRYLGVISSFSGATLEEELASKSKAQKPISPQMANENSAYFFKVCGGKRCWWACSENIPGDD